MLYCPHCGSRSVIEHDGEYVCKKCGTVLGPVYDFSIDEHHTVGLREETFSSNYIPSPGSVIQHYLKITNSFVVNNFLLRDLIFAFAYYFCAKIENLDSCRGIASEELERLKSRKKKGPIKRFLSNYLYHLNKSFKNDHFIVLNIADLNTLLGD